MYRSSLPGSKASVLFVALCVILLGASLFVIRRFVVSFLVSLSSRRLVSLDWSGYFVVSDLVNPQPQVMSINASWIVPRVNVSPGDTFSAAWIGIGGQLDSTLIQAGTEHDSINGQEKYSAWYELLPDDAVTVTALNVSPGDRVTVSIYLSDPTANTWSIEIDDATNGQVFKENFVYGSSRLSADWILERPTVNNRLSALADFGNITFTDCRVTIGNAVGVISSFPYTLVAMYDRQNRELTTVSSLASNGSSFTATYID